MIFTMSTIQTKINQDTNNYEISTHMKKDHQQTWIMRWHRRWNCLKLSIIKILEWETRSITNLTHAKENPWFLPPSCHSTFHHPLLLKAKSQPCSCLVSLAPGSPSAGPLASISQHRPRGHFFPPPRLPPWPHKRPNRLPPPRPRGYEVASTCTLMPTAYPNPFTIENTPPLLKILQKVFNILRKKV